MTLPDKVKIREVALRDGLQSWPDFIPTEIKIDTVKALMAAGVTEFETTAFVSPKAVPQMGDAADLVRQVPRNGLVHAALIPNLKGAELAAAAEVDQFNVVISASEAHNMANFKRPVVVSLAALEPIFELAGEKKIDVMGAVAVAFGCPFSGRVPLEDVFTILEAYVSLGAGSLALADTTGMATPLRIKEMVTAVRERFPGKEVFLHLHNNRGSAMANLYAGLEAGASGFDTSLGGIGGCPNVPQASGNLATEDVVCMLEDMGVKTGIDLPALLRAAEDFQSVLGQTLPGQVLKSGPILAGCGEPCCATEKKQY